MSVSDAQKNNQNNTAPSKRFAPPPNVNPSPSYLTALDNSPSAMDEQKQRYFAPFQGKDYYSPALEQVINDYINYGSVHGQYGDQKNLDALVSQVTNYNDTFRNLFKNYVGREPTNSEYQQFQQSVLIPDNVSRSIPDQEKLRNQTVSMISDSYRQATQDEATKKAEEQTASAVAPGSAFDVWQNSYKNSLNDTEKALTDYQTKLFEKLRPNLLTSLQSQGLLNSGALNEAFAGAAKDLSDTTSNYLAQTKSAINQDIANTRYGITSAPGNTAINNTLNLPNNLTTAGSTALQNVWQDILNRNMVNYQAEAANRYKPESPSLLNQYGGLILGGVASGIGQKLGSKVP